MRLLLGLGLLGLGSLTAASAVVLHQHWWGLATAVLATVAVLVAAPAGWPRIGHALGWAGTVGLLTDPRPEGDYLVPADLLGYALLLFAVAAVAAAIVTLPTRRPAAARGGPPASREDQVFATDRT